jgi:hypothetical protein
MTRGNASELRLDGAHPRAFRVICTRSHAPFARAAASGVWSISRRLIPVRLTFMTPSLGHGARAARIATASLCASSSPIIALPQLVDATDVAPCRGSSVPGGPCSSGPGGGLSSGPGGGLCTGPGAAQVLDRERQMGTTGLRAHTLPAR